LACCAALLIVAGCGPVSTSAPTPTGQAPATSPATLPSATLEQTAAAGGPSASPVAGCAPAPSGIVAWWRAEDDATDAIGGHDGALQGGATFGEGKVGRAFTFDGATQYMSVSPSTALQLRTALSVEGWVYAAGPLSGYAGIAGTWDDNSGGFRTYLFWVLGQSLELVVSPDLASYQRATDPTPFPTDQWVHVGATYDGTTIRLYRDGVEVAKTAQTGPIATNDKAFLIGRTEGGSVGPNFWKGSIDELSVYDHALTAAELGAIRAAGGAGKCRP
jgi:hypothetical protein